MGWIAALEDSGEGAGGGARGALAFAFPFDVLDGAGVDPSGVSLKSSLRCKSSSVEDGTRAWAPSSAEAAPRIDWPVMFSGGGSREE
jgi:hypothetical protein